MFKLKKWRRSLALTLVILLSCGTLHVFASTSNTPESQAAEIVKKMSTEEKVGQMLMPDFRTWNNNDYTVMNDEVAGVIKKYHLGGVILFAENVADTEQTVRLVDGLQKASDKIPLLLSIDQEGGSIVRLQSGTNMPGNMALGATRSTELSYKVGKAIGEELHALGINTNFAPDMDVNLNPDNPVIGVRSFGGNAQMVADLGVAYVKGIQDSKEVATAKHFPGHGDVNTDSHTGLPLVPYDMKRLSEVELKPFKAAMDNNIDMIMTAHIQFPAVDDTKVKSLKDGSEIYLPATLSKKVLTDLVRSKMGFKGVIVTDALNMEAISDNFGKEDAVIRAINAGADIALMPAIIHGTSDIKNLDNVYNAVISAVKNNTIPMTRIDESAERIIALKIRRGIYNPSGSADTRTLDEKIADAKAIVGCNAHKDIEIEASDNAITLIKNDNNVLPFKLKDNDKVVLVAPFSDRLDAMTESLNTIIKNGNYKNVVVKGYAYSGGSVFNDDNMKNDIKNADYVVFGSYVYNVYSRTPGSNYANYAQNIVDFANENNVKLVDVSICYPYEPMYLKNEKALVDIYGRYGNAPNIASAMRVIFGFVNPTGKLPVDVPEPSDKTKNIYNFGYGLVYESTSREAETLVAKSEKSFIESDVDNAEKFINNLPDYPQKSNLIDRLKNVRAEIGKIALATKAVEKAEGSLIQADVDSAKAAADTLTDTDIKAKLLQRIDAVQTKINENANVEAATKAVEKAEGSLIQADVDSAKAAADTLNDTDIKAKLLQRIDAVQTKINENANVEAATKAVEKAEGSLIQADVDSAKAAADTLTDTDIKAKLLQRIDAVQTKINENANVEAATKAVEKAESSLTQTDIDSAKTLINTITDSDVKAKLLQRISTVQEKINSKLPKTGSEVNVNYLIDFGVLLIEAGIILIKKRK